MITIGLLVMFVGFLSPLSTKAVNNIFYALVILPLIGVLFIDKGKSITTGKNFRLFIGFILLSSLPIIISGDIQGVRHIVYAVCFWVTVSSITYKHKKRLDSAIKIACILVILFACTLLFIHFVIHGAPLSTRPNFWATWRSGNPIIVSMFISLFCIMFCSKLFLEKKVLTAFTLFIFASFLILLFQTKAGLFGFVIAIPTLLFIRIFEGKADKNLYILFFAGLSITLSLAYLVYLTGFIDQMLSKGDSHRLKIYDLIIHEYIQCGSLIGCGYNYEIQSTLHNKTILAHPHSVYLSQLLYFGLPSVILLISLQVKSFFMARKIVPNIAVGILVSAIFLLVDGSKLINNPNPTWLFFFLPLAIIDGLSTTKEV
jgi:hypothetical protein|nr:hypothetical protein [Rhodospirillales bacterium]